MKTRAILLFMLFFLGIAFFAPETISAASGEVKLAWDPPVISSDVVGYKVHYGNISRNYTYEPVDAGKNLTLTVTNLVVGQVYYFAATSYDTHGRISTYSNEVSKLITSDSRVVLDDGGAGTGTDTGTGTGASADANADEDDFEMLFLFQK